MITIQQFSQNEIIIKENDLDEYLYLIESGKVKVYKNINSKEIVLAYLEKGAFFGEMALVDERPRSASVVAIEETTLKVFHRSEFLTILKDDIEIGIKFLSGIFGRLRDANSKLINSIVSDGLTQVPAAEKIDENNSYELIIEGLTDKAIGSLPFNPVKIIVNKFPFIIGRESADPFSDTHLAILDSKPLQISRNHLSLVVEDAQIALFDIGSSLGLKLNSERIGGQTKSSGPLYLNEKDNILILGSDTSEFKYNIKQE